MRNAKRKQFFMPILMVLGMLGLCILGLIDWYGAKLREEYDALAEDNLRAYCQGQKADVEADIQNVSTVVDALAQVLDAQAEASRQDWLDAYMGELNEGQSEYELRYYSIEQLQAALNDPLVGPYEQSAMHRLMVGIPAFTAVRNLDSMAGPCFSYTVPIITNEGVIGALRANMEADMLIDTRQTSALYQDPISVVTDFDGSIIYTQNSLQEKDLFVLLGTYGVSAEEQAQLRRQIQEEKLTVSSVSTTQGTLFVASVHLRFHDWSIVNLLTAEEIDLDYQSILKSAWDLSILLVLVTLAVSGGLFFLLKRQERHMRLQQSRYDILAQFSDTVMMEYFCDTDRLMLTENALERFSLDHVCFEHMSDRDRCWELIAPEDGPVVLRMAQQDMTPGEVYYAELRFKLRGGDYGWFGCHYRGVFDESGRKSSIIAKLTDIGHQRRREQELIHQTKTDPLTGISNKSAVRDIERRLAEGIDGTLFMIDIDEFKQINDAYGHDVGDETLRYVAGLLRRFCRSEDIVMRAGGDEFMIFMQGLTDPEKVSAKTRELAQSITPLCLTAGGLLEITLSIGFASTDEESRSYEALYQRADQLMYLHKRNKRCCRSDREPPASDEERR